MAVNWLLNDVTEIELGEEAPLVVVVLDELLLLQAAASRPPTSNIVASPRLVLSFKVLPPESVVCEMRSGGLDRGPLATLQHNELSVNKLSCPN